MYDAPPELPRRKALHTGRTPQSLRELSVKSDDIGKVFVLKKGRLVGQLVSSEEFATIPAADIQVWEAVTVLDVNTA